MAHSANKETVRAGMRPPDYRKAVQRLLQIPAKQSKQQELAKSIGDVYNAAEAMCGVNKAASQAYMKMRKMDEQDRLTFMRDLNGLLDATDWPREGADLVDKAQNKVVPLRLQGKSDEGEPEPDDDDDSVEEADPDEERPNVNDSADAMDDEVDTGDEDLDANGFTEMPDEELEERKRIAREALGEEEAPSE